MADRAGGSLMSPYRKFDPYKNMVLETPAKVANVAKEETDNLARAITLAGLAALAARSAVPTNSSFRRIASFEHKSRSSDSLIDIPADWAAGVRVIVGKPCPITIEPKRWLHFQKDASRFVDEWGRQAAALGWSTLDIFGCHATHPADRYDTMGLVWMISDAEIVAMGAEVANLHRATGIVQRVRKCAAASARILPWDL
jgi:hypothetical protein